MRDLYHNVAFASTLAPAVYSATTSGAEIDLKGFDRVAFSIASGAIVSSGDFSISMEESDVSGSGYTAVAAEHVLSDAPATLTAASNFAMGYIGYKRYVRLVLTKAGGTSIAIAATAILGAPLQAPVA